MVASTEDTGHASVVCSLIFFFNAGNNVQSLKMLNATDMKTILVIGNKPRFCTCDDNIILCP